MVGLPLKTSELPEWLLVAYTRMTGGSIALSAARLESLTSPRQGETLANRSVVEVLHFLAPSLSSAQMPYLVIPDSKVTTESCGVRLALLR